MLKFLDTSNWQGGYNPALTGADAVIVKATQGDWFVDGCCDPVVQQAKAIGMPWGFYHFADARTDAANQASFFVDNCLNYFGEGIPVLDWEDLYEDGELVSSPSIDWVNTFVERIHELTNVWPWIYANPWRFNLGGVNKNCARWVAAYPEVTSPTWQQAQGWECPSADGNVVAWQFCSDGSVDGIGGNVDLDLFYGTKEQWAAYAKGDNRDSGTPGGNASGNVSATVLENDEYKVTVERK